MYVVARQRVARPRVGSHAGMQGCNGASDYMQCVCSQ